MSTPQAKRRRLDEASKTLHKPFKSPFRTPFKTPASSEPPSSDPLEISTPALNLAPTVSTSLTTPTPDVTSASRVTNVAKPLLPHAHLSTPTRSVIKKTPSKPSMTREIMKVRNEIQILSQAYALATSDKEEDMVGLIDMWRTASRAAAEEVFATTRDRVNRMGGVGAWKDREKEQIEWRANMEKEEREAEREKAAEARELAGERGEEVFEDYVDVEDPRNGKGEEAETFKARDDDSFTMDIMLKTLNIDLKLIGYNKDAQRWDG
ncbi:hypothetical protein P280DRAFT_520415 [Massarina eburnea CBS 473.64]|uniref:Swi5-domain-containing protein n=1 Tax=Massarina eburnea CBS 473.64 TaxID=1395130 RepID=A0A6A6RTF9_9PLEO|nr:hypothetical protein P280DRAFT_520415 [Massarina eburnea CBS 473.64]